MVYGYQLITFSFISMILTFQENFKKMNGSVQVQVLKNLMVHSRTKLLLIVTSLLDTNVCLSMPHQASLGCSYWACTTDISALLQTLIGLLDQGYRHQSWACAFNSSTRNLVILKNIYGIGFQENKCVYVKIRCARCGIEQK